MEKTLFSGVKIKSSKAMQKASQALCVVTNMRENKMIIPQHKYILRLILLLAENQEHD